MHSKLQPFEIEAEDAEDEREALNEAGISLNVCNKHAVMSGSYANLLPLHKQNKEGAAELANGVVSCVAYSAVSVCMVISNKLISYTLDVDARDRLPQASVILFQCAVAVLMVAVAKRLGLVEYPSFNLATARSWLPLNILFIGMLFSGFMSLVYVSVPMVTITKNLSNIITVFGEWYLFGEPLSFLTLLSVLIMVVGAALAGVNDLEFNFLGYVWMAINCAFTAGYVLYMRYASTSIKLPRFGMVYYNNLLSMALLLPVCVMRSEFSAFFDPDIMTLPFLASNIVAGVLGFYLNFASLWCVSATNATTYAIVGSLNKVPITVLGFLLFNAKMTSEGVVFISLATAGGFLYAYSKLPSNNNK
jgi:GDP-mannose transporter